MPANLLAPFAYETTPYQPSVNSNPPKMIRYTAKIVKRLVWM